MTSRKIDMLNGSLFSSIMRFSIPIGLSAMLQQLFNSADTAVVGHFADANDLGAVGTNSEIVGLLVSFSTGLSVGANVIAAQYIGAGKSKDIKSTVHCAMAISLIFGFFMGILGQLIALPVMKAIHVDEEILQQAALYLKLYFAGYPFLLLYDFGSALLRAEGDSRRPFIALTVSGIINIILNLIFVIPLKMDVAGVGLSTLISTAFSALLVIYWLSKEENEFHLELLKIRLNQRDAVNILKIGVPAAVQSAAFCFANVFIQSAVNGFGAKATAGNAVSVNFEYFAYYMVTAFGQCTTTFTSQNYAAGNKDRCRKILWLCIVLGLISCAVLTTPLTIWRRQFSLIFTTDPEAINYASRRILMILMLEPVCVFYDVPASAMRGKGHSAIPSIITLCGICLVRILWRIFVFPHIGTYTGLLVVHTGSWFITITAMWIAYAILNR